jgi:hypothetical protein
VEKDMINFTAIRLVFSAVLLAGAMLMFFVGLSSGEEDIFWDTIWVSTIMALVGAGSFPRL